MDTPNPTPELRLLVPGMRRLLEVAAVLVALAGVQLFVFSERTDTFFAWTIDPPLTAAFLGAAYWSSVALEWSAARRAGWSDARIAVPTVFVFTLTTLGVTLVHLDRFHLGSEFAPATRAVTWAWILIYATVPVLMAVVWLKQTRTPGRDRPPRAALPGWMRVAVAVQAVVLGVVGLALLIAPEWVAGGWPWTLTALTGRAIGAWVFSLGVAAGHTLVENDLHRIRPAALAYLAFGVLQVTALVRFPGDMAWTSPGGIAYLVFLAATFVIGGAAVGRGSPEPPAAVTPSGPPGIR